MKARHLSVSLYEVTLPYKTKDKDLCFFEWLNRDKNVVATYVSTVDYVYQGVVWLSQELAADGENYLTMCYDFYILEETRKMLCKDSKPDLFFMFMITFLLGFVTALLIYKFMLMGG